ncbi:transmembrane signal receptor [Lithospermum erythrorhizon]|uniref:Transmembrane signal receptor n=1 Tax=Lithospermum erythrorhizon TaxID=34254 RepID=A0AAV3QLX4_LITER
MKDLGVLKYFLGLLGARTMHFPMEQNHRLDSSTSTPLQDLERYRRLVGRLIYLLFTRPDLSFGVHVLSQFLHEPRQDHGTAALIVVKYFKRSPGQGILLKIDGDLRLTGWCNFDWANCPLTRRSVSGWIVFLGDSPISWKTKKQAIVFRSSAETKYRSMLAVTCELKWLKGLLKSLGVDHPQPMDLKSDSQSALYLAHNPVFHERTKHIEIDCHFLQDAILEGTIRTSNVSTNEQLADIFTKSLRRKQFEFLLRKLGIHDFHAPT